MPYSITKTIKLASRLGGISLNVDGSASVSWDMLDELGGSVESRSRVAGILPDEIELIQSRWLTGLIDDPFTPVTP